jgi:SAM-dependent methyltransferase
VPGPPFGSLSAEIVGREDVVPTTADATIVSLNAPDKYVRIRTIPLVPEAVTGAGMPIPDANVIYSLGSNPEESARLLRQSDELLVDSALLIDWTGLGKGQSAIDLGCGPRGILELLAGRVTPTGRVVGLDANPEHVAMAWGFISEHGLQGVEVITGDARDTHLPSDAFDVVNARTLLVNVPQPESVVAEMVRLAKPGAWVTLMEPDAEHVLCYPPEPAFDRLCEIFQQVFTRNGADSRVGRRVPEMLRNAGTEVLRVEVRAQLYPPESTRRTVRLDLVRSMRPMILDLELATPAELDEWDAKARAHLQDPRTVSMVGVMFMAAARKPM